MTNKVFSSLLAASVLAAALITRAATVKPTLRVDSSPVGDGKAGVVTSYADVVEPVQKAVVTISSTKTIHIVNPLLRQFFGNVPGTEREAQEKGLGSGVIVSPDGYILTNNHVVEGADELTVSLFEGRKLPAKLIGADPKTDLAVIKIDASRLPTITLADSDKLRVGDIVFAVGNPLAIGPSVTMGIVSAKGRQLGLIDSGGYEDFIQTDAAINLGNSGGALVDAKGRLVGINSALISPSRGNIGLGFAVPINLAASVMRSLIDTGTVARGFLGISSSQMLTADLAERFGLPSDTKGVIVTDVTPGSPADKAGVKSSDVIVGVNGKPAPTPDEMRLMIAEMAPGDRVALRLMRDGKPLAVTVTLSHLEENLDELIAGVRAQPITDEVRRKFDIDPRVTGLFITDVAENSPYAESFAPNMVVVTINQEPVTGDLPSARAKLEKPGRHLMLIYYQGSLSYVTLTVAPKG